MILIVGMREIMIHEVVGRPENELKAITPTNTPAITTYSTGLYLSQ
jgi:hypothetical protein